MGIPTVSALLKRINNRELPLARLGGECKDIKKLRQLKAEFARQVGAGSWEEAVQEYPAFATEEKLRQKFLALPFEKDMPAIVAYCQRAIKSKSSTVAPREVEMSTNCFTVDCAEGKRAAVFMPVVLTALTYADVEKLLPGFSGFSMALGKVAADAKIEDVCKVVRALNTAANRVGYVVVLFLSVEVVGSAVSMMQGEGYTTAVAYWNPDRGVNPAKGTLLSSSVVPFIIAVSNTDAARGQILLSPVRCNLFSGTQQDVAEELSSLLTEDDDFVLVLDSTPEFSAGVLKKRNVVVVGEHCVSHQAKVVKMATVQESADEEDDEVIEQPDADN